MTGPAVVAVFAAGVVWGLRQRLGLVVLGILLVAALSAYSQANSADSELTESGPLTLVGVAVSDATGRPGNRGVAFEASAAWSETGWSVASLPRLWVRTPDAVVATGEPMLVEGFLEPASFRVRAGVIGGVIDADRTERLGEARNPLMRIGNRLRGRVLGGLDRIGGTPPGALLAGFLIGDVSRLPEPDVEALRASGLSHFVAVSGSNVALFLGAWWLAAGPLAWGPRRRALVGLAGLAIFVVVTRWEPSVLRAAAMATIVLGGRLTGILLSPWAALCWAVTGLVIVSPGLITNVGFQLSVAATAGILIGIPLWRDRRPRWLWAILGATTSAQAAVAPLLIVHFGSVPMMAPLTNLVAAPLVAISTSVGGIGAILGASPLVGAGAALAGLVLSVARGAADLPQLSGAQVASALALGMFALRVPRSRPLLALGAAVIAVLALVPQGPPDGPEAAFLDIGQGDSTLVRGPRGEVILVDGGPDPALLRKRLGEFGVRRIDLLVVSHRHSDHTAGLVGLDVPVRRFWHPPQLGEGSPLDVVVAEQAARGAIVESPTMGTRASIGMFDLEVLAPRRRYVSPNDGSLVLMLEVGGISVLLSGDIEAIAQEELGPLPATVMKVPHQGSATSDLDWIRASAPSIAVISVGENNFGHPSLDVIEALEASGARVLRTDIHGTIRLRLDESMLATAPLPSQP